MNDKALIVLLAISGVLAVAHFALSLCIVPHIFGIIISVTMIVVNGFTLLYIIKVKKSLSQDYKV